MVECIFVRKEWLPSVNRTEERIILESLLSYRLTSKMNKEWDITICVVGMTNVSE